jgi:hypothetical protein
MNDETKVLFDRVVLQVLQRLGTITARCQSDRGHVALNRAWRAATLAALLSEHSPTPSAAQGVLGAISHAVALLDLREIPGAENAMNDLRRAVDAMALVASRLEMLREAEAKARVELRWLLDDEGER